MNETYVNHGGAYSTETGSHAFFHILVLKLRSILKRVHDDTFLKLI